MEKHLIFDTPIWLSNCDLDIPHVLNTINKHAKIQSSVDISNQGGYQGHNYQDTYFIDNIKNKIPQGDKFFEVKNLQCWVNINDRYHWNDVHNHTDSGVVLSGIFYVQVPENSGNIRFYDTRKNTSGSLYNKYFESTKGTFLKLTPKENLLLFFPPWLDHLVEPNFSNQSRISIAFNVII